jgi:hypothetical protein
MTRAEVANTIQQFLDGTGGQWDWDDFCSTRIADPELDAIRQRCISVHDDFPAEKGYCDQRGFEVLLGLIERLRSQ